MNRFLNYLKCSPTCFIIAGDTSSAMSCHGAEKEWSRRGARWATRGAGRSGGDGQDGQPPRPADQVSGRWGRERRLTGVRWPEGWECERCPRHLFVTTGTATRHSEARPRRRFHAMWLLARSEEACSPSSSPSR